MTALDEIEALALNVAKEAAQDKTDLEQKIDALKALSPYYTLLSKARVVVEDDDESIEHLAEQIHEAENGSGIIQNRTHN